MLPKWTFYLVLNVGASLALYFDIPRSFTPIGDVLLVCSCLLVVNVTIWLGLRYRASVTTAPQLEAGGVPPDARRKMKALRAAGLVMAGIGALELLASMLGSVTSTDFTNTLCAIGSIISGALLIGVSKRTR